MPFLPPTAVAHIITQLSDLQVGCSMTLSIGMPTDPETVHGRIDFAELLENQGLACEINTTVKGVAQRLVVVFIVKGHELFQESKAVRGIQMAHGHGDLVRFVAFEDTKVPSTLSPGVYSMSPGTLLVTSYDAYRCKNGEVTSVSNFTNLSEADGSFQVGRESLKTDVSHSPADSSMLDKLIENDVFAVLETDGSWSIQKRRAHGLEPVFGERTTLTSLKKSEGRKLFKLTRPNSAIQVGNVFESSLYYAKILELGQKTVKALRMDMGGGNPTECTVVLNSDGSEFGDNRLALPDGQAERTGKTIVFPTEFMIPSGLMRSGNILVTKGDKFTMTGLHHSNDKTAVLFVNGGDREFSLVKAGGNFKIFLFDGEIHEIASPPLHEGGLYEASWQSLASRFMMYTGGVFVQARLDPVRLLENQNPFDLRGVKYLLDANGRPFLPDDRSMGFPALKALPGQWGLQIPAAGNPSIILDTLGVPVEPWTLTSTQTCQDYTQGTNGGWDEARSTQAIKIPVLSADFDVTERLPKRVVLIMNFRCENCETRCIQTNTTPVVTASGTRIRVCPQCREEHARRCTTCRAYFMSSIMATTSSCRLCHSMGGQTLVHCYSHKPSPKFHGEGPLYFGTEVELEMRDRDGYRDSMAAKARQIIGEAWYAKTDGSIENGLEFVSHPFSLKYLLDNAAKYKTLFNTLHESMEARNNCGIHIHTSKDGYAVRLDSIPEVAANIKMTKLRLIQRGLLRAQKFIYGNPKLTIHFAGRVSRYAQLETYDKKDKARTGTANSEIISLSMNPSTSKRERYAAMNFTEKTVEFRIFRTTTNWDEYLRNVLFVDSVVQYARGHAMPKAGAPSTLLYREFLNESKELYAPVIAHYDAWSAKPAMAKAAK